MKVRYKFKSEREVKELAKGYYYKHFQAILAHVSAYYRSHPDVEKITANYKNLSKDEQLFFIKLSSLKTTLYRIKRKLCKDIDNEDQIKQSFMRRGLLKPLQPQNFYDLVKHLNKLELVEILTLTGAKFKKSSKVGELRETLISLGASHVISNSSIREILDEEFRIFDLERELKFFYFLYFGEIGRTVNLLVQAELGFRRTNQHYHSATQRFYDTEVAENLFKLHIAISSLDELSIDEVRQFLEINPYDDREEELFNEFLYQYIKANKLTLEQEGELLCRASMFPALKLYYKWLDKVDEPELLRERLENSMENPKSEEEFHFSYNFFHRKFTPGRTLAIKTQLLQEAPSIAIDESYLGRPEMGVKEHYQKNGYTVRRYENYIWRSLFGIVFWEELFEDERSRFHTEFDRMPDTIIKNTFYETFKAQIHSKLNEIDRPKFLMTLLSKVTQHYGKRNGIFSWKKYFYERAKELYRYAPKEAIKTTLLNMAQNYLANKDGFPDLALFKDGKLELIEVKTQGDSLRLNQIRRLDLLEKAGFKVSIVRADYRYNPKQAYCVVDVETTGGRANYSRVTEIGIVKMVDGVIVERFESLINPERLIPKRIQEITGINNAMVASAPVFHEVASKILQILEGSIFVAHNVRFDYSFFQSEFKRIGIELTMPTYCTCANSRKHFSGLKSYSLKNLCLHFDIDLTTHHRAMCDAEAAAHILNLINERRARQNSNPISKALPKDHHPD